MTKKRTKKKRVTKRSGPTTAQLRAQTDPQHSQWPWPLRPMQQLAWDQIEAGKKRLGLFWHRRAGKDVFGMSLARNQMRKKVGSYVHFFPKHVHAKRALWRGIDPRKGSKFIDIAFGDLEADRNNQDMMIEMMNGSTWTLLGSDNYDSNVIGGNVVGVVFSEWAMCNPKAWDYIRPILRENGGTATFITTFRGRNHAWKMAQQLKDNPDWYIDIRDITQTSELDGSPIISLDDVDRDRADGMPESLVQQEYFCNPDAVADGAIYGKQIERLNDDKNRQHAMWQPGKPVYAVWNFGLPTFAACLHIQDGNVLDATVMDFCSLGEAVAACYRRPYPIQKHLIHSDQRELMGPLGDFDIYPDVLNHHNHLVTTTATSSFLETCKISGDRCALFMDALGGYVVRERFDSQAADLAFSDQAVQSWHCQLANALETWAAWEYYSGGDTWSKTPDYTTQDRIAKTIP